MSLRTRLQRLEALVSPPPADDDAPLTPEQEAELCDDLSRLLAGESREEIARSKGKPWPPPDNGDGEEQMTDDDLREVLRSYLEEIAPPSEDCRAEVASAAGGEEHPEDLGSPLSAGDDALSDLKLPVE
jgi:hypothetical protein